MFRKKTFKAVERFDHELRMSSPLWPSWFKALLVFLLDFVASEMEREHNPIAEYLFLGLGFVIALGAFAFRKRGGPC